MDSLEDDDSWPFFLNDTSIDSLEFQLEKEEGHAPWNMYFNFIAVTGSCFIGFTMNSLIVFLISKHFHSKISLTNILILILALVDIGNLISMGMELAYWIEERWILGTFLCKVYTGLFKSKVLMSFVILLWLSLDFLNGPTRSHNFRLTWLILAGVSLTIPFVLALMNMYAVGVEYHHCFPTNEFTAFTHTLHLISVWLLIPLVIFVWLVKSGLLCKSSTTNFENPNQLKTALALTLCHIICWMPNTFIQIWFRLWDPSIASIGKITLEIILAVPVSLLAICSAANPILVLYCRDDLRSFTARILCIRKLFWRNLSPGTDQVTLGESMEGVETTNFA